MAVNILVKALTAAPFPDFSLCISLLGEAPVKTLSSNDAALSTGAAGIITEPIIVHLATLSTFLFETKFRDFWALYNSGDFADVRKYTANAAGFEEDVRKMVLNSVKGTFRTISEARIGGYLNLQGADLAKFINEQPGWELSNGTVTVPANIDNEVKPTVTREEISLESMYGFLTQTCPSSWRRHNSHSENTTWKDIPMPIYGDTQAHAKCRGTQGAHPH